MAQIKITLVKSLIGCKSKQISTAKSLNLTKIGDFKILERDASAEGKIKVINHLVTVTEVNK